MYADNTMYVDNNNDEQSASIQNMMGVSNTNLNTDVFDEFEINWQDVYNGISEDVENLGDTDIMNIFELAQKPQSCKEQEKYHVNRFKGFLKNTLHVDENFECIEGEVLNSYLRRFYFNLKKKDGEPYAPPSLLCIRAAIHRYLIGAPHFSRLNIITGFEFNATNNMLKSKIGQFIRSGKKANSYSYIELGDQTKLERYFNRENPVILQQEIWYNITYFFGNRGREGIRELTRQNVEFKFDSDGNEFARMNVSFQQKNVRSTLKKSDYSDGKISRIYATRNNLRCPVQALKCYLHHIKNCEKDALFPKPRQSFVPFGYEKKQVLGKSKLGGMMKEISKMAHLSKLYTNHCIRPTVVTNLKKAGFADREICAITGHKNERSVARYDKGVNDRTLKRLSDSLHESESIKNTKMNVDNVCIFSSQTGAVAIASNDEKNIDPNNEMHTMVFNNCTNITVNVHK